MYDCCHDFESSVIEKCYGSQRLRAAYSQRLFHARHMMLLSQIGWFVLKASPLQET